MDHWTTCPDCLEDSNPARASWACMAYKLGFPCPMMDDDDAGDEEGDDA